MFSIYPDCPLNCIRQLNLVCWCCIIYIFICIILHRLPRYIGAVSYIEKKLRYQRTENKMAQAKRTKGKIKYWITLILLKSEGKLGWFGRLGSPCFTSGSRRASLFANTGISHEWAKLWLGQTKHFCGNLWHRNSVIINDVMMTRRWVQIKH